MTSALFKYTLAAILTIHMYNAIAFAENTLPTASTQKPSNRFLSHIFRKYGSHGTISFEVIN